MQVGQRKIYRQAIYLLAALLLLFACRRPPELPIVPEISYLSISKHIGYIKVGTIVEKIDSVVISVTFKDGDGDLGSRNGLSENYYCDVLVKDSLGFSKMGDKNGQFSPLNTDDRLGPIEGTLNYSPTVSDLLLGDSTNPQNKYTIKCRVYIKDNAGHQSNTVETDTIEVQIY